jgi:hypothetical protein
MTPERTMTSVVTKELALDGTSAIKELKSDQSECHAQRRCRRLVAAGVGGGGLYRNRLSDRDAGEECQSGGRKRLSVFLHVDKAEITSDASRWLRKAAWETRLRYDRELAKTSLQADRTPEVLEHGPTRQARWMKNEGADAH